MLKIAVQKSDRISKGFLELLNKCGLKIETNQSSLYCKFSELPIELFFVRGSDISALMQSKFDVAVIGKDSFLEYGLNEHSQIKKDLDFAKCRLCFAGKKPQFFKDFQPSDLNHKTIATSYVNILKNYLDDNKINAKIVQMNGSVESAIELELADVICDIVQTGSTLLQHGLVEFATILNLQAVLITTNNFSQNNSNLQILNDLLFRINAVVNAKPCKYIMFNLKRDLLDSILAILPAGKSPTLLDLADKNYYAVHTLCTEAEIWDTCKRLQQNGAEDILVSDINLRFL
jgi:ATP phosphoribosyltransferase